MNIQTYGKIAAYCLQNWPEKCDHIIQIADQVCEQKFLFDMPWDMERTTEMVTFEGKIDWHYQHNGDKEFMFQLNRHRFFIILGQAYHLTGDDKYANCFVHLLNDWIDRVPFIEKTGNHPWRSLETGLRGEYWTNAMALFADSPLVTEAVKGKYRASLAQHAIMLRTHHSPYHKQSNWGVIQDHGLFAIALELGNRADQKEALNRLTQQSVLQLTQGGMHWEQSCMYHNEVLNCFLDVILRARRQQVTLPQSFLRQTQKMVWLNLKWMKPNRHQPLFGDSDDTDLRDLLSLCAYIFEDAQLKNFGFDKLDFESAWLLGMDGVEAYDKLHTEPLEKTNAYLDESGLYVLRTGWEPTANYLCMHNGYTGGGHAHGDKLHFDLCIHGEDVLVDNGRYTYKNTKERRFLMGTQGHNVSVMDGNPFLKGRGWSYTKLAYSVKQPVYEDDGHRVVLLQGGHLGYIKLLGSAYASRRILWIKPDIYVVFDTYYTQGVHRYQQMFHFNPNGSVQLADNKAVYEGETARAELYFIGDHLSVKGVDTLYSPHYNCVLKNRGLKTAFAGCGTTGAMTVIYGSEKNTSVPFTVEKLSVTTPNRGKIPLSPHKAQGIRIKKGDEEYTIIVAHKEMMTPLEAGGKLGSGILSVFLNEEEPIIFW